jgi:hypothetical protein
MKGLDYYIASAFGLMGFLYGILIHGTWFSGVLIAATLLLALSGIAVMLKDETIKTIAIVIFVVVAGPFVVGIMVGATVDLIHHSQETHSQGTGNCNRHQYIVPQPEFSRPSKTHTIYI